MNRRISALAISAVVLLGLTACAGGSEPTEESDTSNSAEESTTDESTGEDGAAEEPAAGGDQSVEEACGLISGAGTNQAGDAMSAMGEGDFDAAVEALTGATDELNAAIDQVSNEEVLPVATSVKEDMTRLVELLPKAQSGDSGAGTELQDIITSLTESNSELSEICSA